MLKAFSFINFFEFVATVYSRYSAVHTVCSCLKNKSIVKLEKVAILSFTYLFVFYYYLLTLFYYNYSYFFSFTFFKLPCEQRQHFRGMSENVASARRVFSSTLVRMVRIGSYAPDSVSPCFNTKLMIT